MKEKSVLVRAVVNADGVLSIDTSGKLPGRGAYICRNLNCLQKAQKSKGLERSLKRSIPPEIYESVRWLNA